jgi:hypothetical protein
MLTRSSAQKYNGRLRLEIPPLLWKHSTRLYRCAINQSINQDLMRLI